MRSCSKECDSHVAMQTSRIALLQETHGVELGAGIEKASGPEKIHILEVVYPLKNLNLPNPPTPDTKQELELC